MYTLEEADFSGRQIQESKMPIWLFRSLVSPRPAVPSVSALLCPPSSSSGSNGEQWGMALSLGSSAEMKRSSSVVSISLLELKLGGFGFLSGVLMLVDKEVHM